MGWWNNKRNKRWAKKLGWTPSWFSATGFDDELASNIKAFQTAHGLTPDGLCGPMTFRRIITEREANRAESYKELKGSYIICEGEPLSIEWDKVVNIWDPQNLALSKGYREYKVSKRDVRMIVTHFDVCLSAASCKRVLEKKGISSHFVIDNDGTIYQMVDPQHEAWHAGKRLVNKRSIGIDLSNAIYVKYQKWYRSRGYPRRPVLKNIPIHGTKIKECLGFYPVQLQAYKVLVKKLCSYYGIPIAMPMNKDGTVLRQVHLPTKKGRFKGIVNHFHISRGKWDTANLDWDMLLKDLNRYSVEQHVDDD